MEFRLEFANGATAGPPEDPTADIDRPIADPVRARLSRRRASPRCSQWAIWA